MANQGTRRLIDRMDEETDGLTPSATSDTLPINAGIMFPQGWRIMLPNVFLMQWTSGELSEV